MRRIVLLALAVTGFTALMYAGDPANMEQMTGTICDSKCVTQTSNTATCDPTCTEKSGTAVFVDDKGGVKQIANQDICKSYMGKHVKMSAADVPGTEKQREETLRIQELEEEHP